jgi:hypothetical protein
LNEEEIYGKHGLTAALFVMIWALIPVMANAQVAVESPQPEAHYSPQAGGRVRI